MLYEQSWRICILRTLPSLHAVLAEHRVEPRSVRRILPLKRLTASRQFSKARGGQRGLTSGNSLRRHVCKATHNNLSCGSHIAHTKLTLSLVSDHTFPYAGHGGVTLEDVTGRAQSKRTDLGPPRKGNQRALDAILQSPSPSSSIWTRSRG